MSIKYDPEMKAKAVRLFQDHVVEYPVTVGGDEGDLDPGVARLGAAPRLPQHGGGDPEGVC